MKMDFEVDKHMAEHTDKAQGLIEKTIEQKRDNDGKISKNLEDQKDAFKKRLEARRNLSFMKSGNPK